MNALWEAMRVLHGADSTALTESAVAIGECYNTIESVYFGPRQYAEDDHGIITSAIPY